MKGVAEQGGADENLNISISPRQALEQTVRRMRDFRKQLAWTVLFGHQGGLDRIVVMVGVAE